PPGGSAALARRAGGNQFADCCLLSGEFEQPAGPLVVVADVLEDVDLSLPLAEIDRPPQLLEDRRELPFEFAVLLRQLYVQQVEADGDLAQVIAEARDEEAVVVLRGQGALAVPEDAGGGAVRVE